MLQDQKTAEKQPSPDHQQRQRWMAQLARLPGAQLESLWDGVDNKPAYTMLRAPETGLVMVRGRAGGTGTKFNLGEMTVTRCVVRLANGYQGVSYVSGRDKRQAELAAVFDGLLQAGDLDAETLTPATEEAAQRDAARAGKVAATKVDFFTMVRGE
ncbi:MAG: phosphonate C-P lyase system protein PhnG [Magnetospiraceae bacterium]